MRRHADLSAAPEPDAAAAADDASLNQRRLPRQARSRRTVEAILKAATHDLLMATTRRDPGYAGMLLKNLRVCLHALATRLQRG